MVLNMMNPLESVANFGIELAIEGNSQIFYNFGGFGLFAMINSSGLMESLYQVWQESKHFQIFIIHHPVVGMLVAMEDEIHKKP